MMSNSIQSVSSAVERGGAILLSDNQKVAPAGIDPIASVWWYADADMRGESGGIAVLKPGLHQVDDIELVIPNKISSLRVSVKPGFDVVVKLYETYIWEKLLAEFKFRSNKDIPFVGGKANDKAMSMEVRVVKEK